MSAKVKRTLYRTVKPKRVAAPIQYHSFSAKMSKLFNVAIPIGVTPSEDYKIGKFK